MRYVGTTIQSLMVLLAVLQVPAFATSMPKLTASSVTPVVKCTGKNGASPSILLPAVMGRYGVKPGVHTVAWMNEMLPKFGLRPALPGGRDDVLAMRSLALAERGLLVAAKISHEDAQSVASYRSSSFSAAMSYFLAAVVQPVPHGDDEHSSNEDDLVTASRSLDAVVKRVELARQDLGPLYRNGAVRFYILGHAFDDVVAVETANNWLCGQNLAPEVLTRISGVARRAKAK